jgi:hypothetical protein
MKCVVTGELRFPVGTRVKVFVEEDEEWLPGEVRRLRVLPGRGWASLQPSGHPTRASPGRIICPALATTHTHTHLCVPRPARALT